MKYIKKTDTETGSDGKRIQENVTYTAKFVFNEWAQNDWHTFNLDNYYHHWEMLTTFLVLWLVNVYLTKALSHCHKPWFSNPYIFATRWCEPFNIRLFDLTEFTVWNIKPSGCKDIGIRK